MPDTTDTTHAPPRLPELIPIDTEPGWAHVWATMPNGRYEPIADYHLTCGRAKAFTVNLGGGRSAHVCRACAIDAATGKNG